MTSERVLRPAKRLMVFYFTAYVAVLALLAAAIANLEQTAIRDFPYGLAWKAAVFIGAGLLGYAFLWRRTSVFRISGEYISSSTGIFAREEIRIPLSRVVDYRVIRSLLERVLGLGSLHIGTAGRDGDELVMPLVSIRELAIAGQLLKKLLRKDPNQVSGSSTQAA